VDFSGADSLTVRISDSAGGQVTGTVNVTVNPINDAPVVHDDTLRVVVYSAQPIVVAALAHDADADGDTLVPTIVSQPRGGTVVVDPSTHALTFEPANGYRGPIEFTYRVTDGNVDSTVATVRALIGDFEPLVFLSDYTTPGLAEVHVFDGFEVRRVSDDLPAGSQVISYSVSYDLKTLVYVADGSTEMRVYVKALDGTGAAALRYTTPPKAPPFDRGLRTYPNADGT
jgi:hypothetical protein